MPRISQKLRYVDQLCQQVSLDLLWNDSHFWDSFDEAVDDVLLLSSVRYSVPRNPVPKSDQWYHTVLPMYDDLRFQQFIRVSRSDFGRILSMIEKNPVFCSDNSHKQTEISKQLAITLYKLGSDGSSNSIFNVAAMFSVGEGTVMLIVERVINAIISLEKEWINWPNENQRSEIVQFMGDKLPKCIGYVDGSHINLDEAPLDDPESYFSRKQRYAIQIQAICDNQRLLRNVYIGYPSSVHDARVYANSDIGRNPQHFLSEGQWIAGDSAYGVSNVLITPFRSNATTGTARQRKAFNKYFSSFRVNIECTFGIMKETFGSLKGLRIRVDKKRGHKLACNWILACCILYNVIKDSLPPPDFEHMEDEEDNEHDARQGNDAKRLALFNFVTAKLAL